MIHSISIANINPPHFHADYVGYRCLVDILSGCVIRVSFAAKQLKLVLAWNELHRDELMQNWELTKEGKQLLRIEPL